MKTGEKRKKKKKEDGEERRNIQCIVQAWAFLINDAWKRSKANEMVLPGLRTTAMVSLVESIREPCFGGGYYYS